MQDDKNELKLSLFLNFFLIACFVLNCALTISILLNGLLVIFLSLNILSKDDFVQGIKDLNLDDVPNNLTLKISLLVTLFLFSTIICYNSLNKIL